MKFSESCFCFLVIFFSLISVSLGHSGFYHVPISGQRADEGLFGEGLFLARRSLADANTTSDVVVANSSFILAAERTHRKDPIDSFKYYNGGWNISNDHYWASAGFSAAPLFLVAAAWFLAFGLLLLGMCCYFCCFPRRTYTASRAAYLLSLILLILFTVAAIIGCIVLFTGQGKFNNSTSNILDYVVGQADSTVNNLRNFSDTLGAAKGITIDQVLLPADVRVRINDAEAKLNSSANNLQTKTEKNSRGIRRVLRIVRLALIILAAVMLALAFVGFLLSILGLQTLVYILVVIGWILVTGTFILSGIFLIFHNVVEDTCVAMDEWVRHPTEHTALDNILPCVDVSTANESLYRGREVSYQLVSVINQVINNVANRNLPPVAGPLYYNQSGPLIPTLCNPYTSNLDNRLCAQREVTFDNASQVWQGFVCKTRSSSGNEICTTPGRLTPTIYNQMTSGAKVSYGLYRYGPFLASVQDCTYVRQTFTDIYNNNCPGLNRYSKWVYVGLALVAAAVMMSLIFWVIYAKERRHRYKYGK